MTAYSPFDAKNDFTIDAAAMNAGAIFKIFVKIIGYIFHGYGWHNKISP
jgi:hypothetical protein